MNREGKMKKAVHTCMVIALFSLVFGTIYAFGGAYLLSRITPRALLLFAGISLLFGINFALLELMKK